MLSVKKVSTRNEFSRLKTAWTALLKRSDSDTVFLTWEWMYTWWECFKGGKQLFILAVYDENKNLTGIAPLCRDKKVILGIPVLNYIKFLGTMPISSDHLDFIIRKGKERETLAAIINYILKEDKWDICLLSNIPVSSLTGTLFRDAMGERSFLSEISQVCPYLTLPARIEDFHSTLSGNMRNTIKRRRRNLFKKYKDVEFVIWESPSDIENAMKRLFELHGKRWKILKHKGNLISDDVREFHKRIAGIFLDFDMLRLYFLRIQKYDVAALYTFKYNNKLFYYQGGWDPEWSKDHVGSVLTNLVIEDAINKGYSEYDFLRGTEHYKTRFTDKKRKESDIFILNSFNAMTYHFFRNLYHKERGSLDT